MLVYFLLNIKFYHWTEIKFVSFLHNAVTKPNYQCFLSRSRFDYLINFVYQLSRHAACSQSVNKNLNIVHISEITRILKI